MNHWVFNCKKVNQLVSNSMDERLPFFKRMGIRFHLKMCKVCSRYLTQIKIIQELLRLHEEDMEASYTDQVLGKERKDIIKKMLSEELKAT